MSKFELGKQKSVTVVNNTESDVEIKNDGLGGITIVLNKSKMQQGADAMRDEVVTIHRKTDWNWGKPSMSQSGKADMLKEIGSALSEGAKFEAKNIGDDVVAKNASDVIDEFMASDSPTVGIMFNGSVYLARVKGKMFCNDVEVPNFKIYKVIYSVSDWVINEVSAIYKENDIDVDAPSLEVSASGKDEGFGCSYRIKLTLLPGSSKFYDEYMRALFAGEETKFSVLYA